MASQTRDSGRDDGGARVDEDALAATATPIDSPAADLGATPNSERPASARSRDDLAARETVTSARGIPEPIVKVESAPTLAAPVTDAPSSSAVSRDSAVSVDTDETLASGPSASGANRDGEIFEGLEKGARLDRFIVVDKLGEGGMGVVIVAYDPDLDRKVAIKLLRPGAWDTGRPSDGRQRFLREAQAMAKLSHPNVVVVHGVGTVGNRVYIAMEYVDGGTLTAWQKREKRGWRDLVAIYCRAGRGLAAAHEAGLVHRDFKPDNVLVGNDDRVRVTDFGIVGTTGAIAAGDGTGRRPRARSSSTPLSTPLTHAGVLLGTPIYMAPEQLERKPADARADQFSFCVALHEALYGERPFAGKSYDELNQNVSSGNLRPVPAAGVPGWVRAILLRGLSADPDHRYPTMAELIDALSSDPVAARRRRMTIAATVGGLVLLVGATVFGLVRGSAVVDPAARCQSGGRAGLDRVWNQAKSAALEQGFMATGQPYAADSHAGLAAALDQRVEAVVTMRIEACEATEVRGEQSETMLGRREACLDRRVGEMAALVEVLRERPSGAAVARARGAVEALTAVAWCGNLDALATEVEPPAAAMVAPVTALESRLDRVVALSAIGERGEARREAAGVAAAARELEYLPFLAEALYRLGVVLASEGPSTEAEAILREAVQIAAQAKDDRLVARIWIELVAVVGGQAGRFDEAMALRTTADAAVARAGDDPIDRAELARTLCDLWSTRPQSEQVLDQGREAVAGFAKGFGPQTLAVATALLRLGAILEGRGDAGEAAAVCERALAIREAMLGAHHPAVAEAAFAVARTGLAAGGDHGAAIAAATRARSIYAATGASDGVSEISTWLEEGR